MPRVALPGEQSRLRYPAAMVRLLLSELAGRVGSEIGVSDWFEVTQRVIDDFAQATQDLQWIHVDAARAARESPFRNQNGVGCTVAHGFLTLSLLSQWLDATVVVTDRRAGINAGFNKVRFSAPVPDGSRIRARFVLVSSDPVSGGAKLLWKVSVEREGESRPVLTAEWLTRVRVAATRNEAITARAHKRDQSEQSI